MTSVFIIIANEEEEVKECFVVSDSKMAQEIFINLKRIYGGANVCLASRAVDDIELLMTRGLIYSMKWLEVK